MKGLFDWPEGKCKFLDGRSISPGEHRQDGLTIVNPVGGKRPPVCPAALAFPKRGRRNQDEGTTSGFGWAFASDRFALAIADAVCLIVRLPG